MLFTVTTVKDTKANVQRFVERNLSAGIDHMFLFVEELDDAELDEFLAGHPHVTQVRSDDAYWKGRRPDDLNSRQVLNSNLVMAALAPFEWADWLFHIDADEVVQIDRDRLLAEVSADEPYVRLKPLEAVSQRHWEGEVTRFKRLLAPEELELLVALGVIDKADNREYFRGHTHGKLGVRPGLERRLQLHRVVGQDLVPLAPRDAEWLRLLHYESYDGEEFVRKWAAHVSAGPLRFRPNRERLLTALTVLSRTDTLSDERRAHYLMRLYDRWVKDDLETLEDLGLLVVPAPGSHLPESFPPGGLDDVRQLLTVLAATQKRSPHPNGKGKPLAEWVGSVSGDLDGPLAARVLAEVERAKAARSGADGEQGESRLVRLAGRFGKRP